MPPGFSSKKQEAESSEAEKLNHSAEWGGDGLIGFPGLGLGSKQKSLAEIFQDDLSRSTPASGHPSRPASRNAFENNDDTLGPTEAMLKSSSATQHSNGLPTSYSYGATLAASLSRCGTSDTQHITRVPSPVPTRIGGGRVNPSEKRNLNGQNHFNGSSSHSKDSADLVTALSGMNLSNEVMAKGKNPTHFDQNTDYNDGYISNMTNSHSGGSNNLYFDGSSNNF